MDDVRAYESPPRRPQPWLADRPGDIRAGQPRGGGLGSPGPDQGYALKLAHEVFEPQLDLGGVGAEDAIAGCTAIALKRGSIFGRAPIAHDLRLAFRLWGFLDGPCPPELAELRARVFEEAAHPYHYWQVRALADAVPESTLRLHHDAVRAADWRSLIDVDALSPREPRSAQG
jgi:hypothetical protein